MSCMLPSPIYSSQKTIQNQVGKPYASISSQFVFLEFSQLEDQNQLCGSDGLYAQLDSLYIRSSCYSDAALISKQNVYCAKPSDNSVVVLRKKCK